MSESRVARLKRLRMRAWRRGTKEMDLILGPFADGCLAGMDEPRLRLFDTLLGENDQDLYPWVTGAQPAPAQYRDLIAEISRSAIERHENAHLTKNLDT
ncbi:MAG: succinate dehydrogenase assembly factor 2 [Rhodobacteraceae bacterium]|nr:succinate dehydrogenase assembly factor 2 [Paracoccaceae bacterium]